MIHLDDNIYVVANIYDEALQIHIRQYTQFGDKLYPTKKGVVLNLPRWFLLEVNIDKLDQHVKSPIDDSLHLGGQLEMVKTQHYLNPRSRTRTERCSHLPIQ